MKIRAGRVFELAANLEFEVMGDWANYIVKNSPKKPLLNNKNCSNEP